MSYEAFDFFVQAARGYPAVTVRDTVGTIVGFAMLRRHHLADTLRRTVEISSFLLPQHTGMGTGTAIVDLFALEGRKAGEDTILASISSLNEESVRFHLKNGFTECGRSRNVGRKFGKDFHVVWMQRMP